MLSQMLSSAPYTVNSVDELFCLFMENKIICSIFLKNFLLVQQSYRFYFWIQQWTVLTDSGFSKHSRAHVVIHDNFSCNAAEGYTHSAMVSASDLYTISLYIFAFLYLVVLFELPILS